MGLPAPPFPTKAERLRLLPPSQLDSVVEISKTHWQSGRRCYLPFSVAFALLRFNLVTLARGDPLFAQYLERPQDGALPALPRERRDPAISAFRAKRRSELTPAGSSQCGGASDPSIRMSRSAVRLCCHPEARLCLPTPFSLDCRRNLEISKNLSGRSGPLIFASLRVFRAPPFRFDGACPK